MKLSGDPSEACALMAISPLDGRYAEKLNPLRPIFSEFGLIKFRVVVEIRWLKMLAEFANLPELPPFNKHTLKILDNIIENFSLKDAIRIKKIESGINHDVKAVEYFLKESLLEYPELANITEFIHFGCTSEDINNLAYGLMLLTARTQTILPALEDLMSLLKKFAHQHAHIAMLSRTHGQAATPTTVGKEIANVIARLQRQRDQLASVMLLGKLNGASGNYNAFASTYPEVDWQNLCKNFVSMLGLNWNPYTTQIEPHDSIAELFAIILRINNIVLDLNKDMWGYIAINYFKQTSFSNEVGSSTMPHKVNPIDFENSEGNLGIANALLEHMMSKLQVSRWQRDLSDSTVLRNIGVVIAHSILAYQSTCKGIQKVEPHTEMLEQDLENHWEVLAEVIQTVMRRYKLESPYERLKTFTRGKPMNKSLLHAFISDLELPDEVKKQLLALSPHDYIGYAEELAKRI